jgi:enediyne polyketide synthase
MGERLGRVDLLTQYGIAPIPADEGVRMLRELLKRELPETSVVVTGRFGNPPTLLPETGPLPFLRFLEKVRTYVRGVELITEAELSAESEPYLNDHIFDGERLLPGVMGLEAMSQIAMALLETGLPLNFDDVLFQWPVIVPEGQSVKVRLCGSGYRTRFLPYCPQKFGNCIPGRSSSCNLQDRTARRKKYCCLPDRLHRSRASRSEPRSVRPDPVPFRQIPQAARLSSPARQGMPC